MIEKRERKRRRTRTGSFWLLVEQEIMGESDYRGRGNRGAPRMCINSWGELGEGSGGYVVCSGVGMYVCTYAVIAQFFN